MKSLHGNKPLSFVLVKPAGADCNLNCTYCFYLEKAALYPGRQTHRMDEATLEQLMRRIGAEGEKQVSIAWQGGEPTLMGIPFFRKAIAFQEKYCAQQQVQHLFQTNGVLIDDVWAEFLGKNRFLVGLSLDGPEPVHNRYRMNRNGEPRWHTVMKALETLRRHNAEVNAMCCVTRHSSAAELYDFFKQHGFEWMQFIPAAERDRSEPEKMADFSVTPEGYGEFLTDLFELWKNDFRDGQPTTFIRNFDALFFTYLGYPAPECTLPGECGVYPVVEHNGDVYSCDFFVSPETWLGNIHENGLKEMLNSNKQAQFGKRKRKLPDKCTTCPLLAHCHGGCPKYRVNGEPYFCESTRLFLHHAGPFFTEMAHDWKKQYYFRETNTYDATREF